MNRNIYKNLYQALLSDTQIDEFVFIRKVKKKIKTIKVSLGLSYGMLLSSLVVSNSELGFTLIVASLVLILYFKDKINSYKILISQNKESFEDIIKQYIDSNILKDFRKIQLSKLQESKLSKIEYLSIVKEEINLLSSLIKRECNEDNNINIIIYKNSIQNILDLLKDGVNNKLIEKDELEFIRRKWFSDLQVLCNQYSKTDIEVELKYLYSKTDFN